MCRSQRPHIANLRAVVCVGRLPDPITGFVGPALPTIVRDQSEHEPLPPAATPDPRRAAEQFVHGTDGGGEGKRHDRSRVERCVVRINRDHDLLFAKLDTHQHQPLLIAGA
jgi:hypothetical protein